MRQNYNNFQLILFPVKIRYFFPKTRVMKAYLTWKFVFIGILYLETVPKWFEKSGL